MTSNKLRKKQKKLILEKTNILLNHLSVINYSININLKAIHYLDLKKKL